MPARDRWRDGLDPTVTPAATAVFGVAYLAALVISRALIVSDARIAAVWPAVGVGFAWLLPLLQAPRWWSRRSLCVPVLVMVLATAAVNVMTGMAPAFALLGGVCNTVTDVVAVRLYLRWRGGSTPYLGSGPDLRRLSFACVLGNAAGWLTLPLAQLVLGESSWRAALFWFIRNLVGLLYGAVAAGLIFRRERWYLRGVGPVLVGGATLATVVGILALEAVDVRLPLVYLVIIAAIGSAAVFSVLETFLYLVVVGVVVLALTLLGHSPFGLGAADVESAHVHTVLLVVLVVAMAGVADRESRSHLLHQVRQERAVAREEAIRSAQQADLLGAVIRSMTDGVLVLAEEGRVAMRNATAARLTGMDNGAAPRSAAPRLADAIEQSLRDGAVDLVAEEPGCLSGCTVVVQAQELTHGPDRATVVALHDVTESRRQVDELRMLARVAAHDLRQPLTSIEMWTDLLREDLGAVPEGVWREPTDHVLAAVGRMNGFLTDLMGYAMARDMAIAPERLTLGDVAHDAVEDVAGGITRSGAMVTIRAQDEVVGDRAQLRQLLGNLFGNALKYVVPGTVPRIAIESHRDGDWVVLWVDDAGIGIPAGQEAAIFGEFYRAPEHASAYAGTGLGLAICRRIAERHGGRIAALASPLGGTRIELRLPAPGVIDVAQPAGP
ncbi:MAG: hypothetical protein IPK37_05080 [Austwickia sp.]|jgi:signal transduction histidine kinase|nr:MAG: hypothetical protein IPK37_05080 [Austwickia sp.]